MKKKNKLLEVLAFAVFSVLVLALLYVLIGKGIITSAGKGEAAFKADQAKLQETQELVRSLPNPAKAAEEVRRQDADLKEMVFTKKQLPKLIQVLAKTAAGNGLGVVTIRQREDLKDPDLPPGVAKIYVELVVYGEYRALAEFIEKVKDPPYPFSTESLTLTKRMKIPGEGGNTGPLEADLVLSTVMIWE